MPTIHTGQYCMAALGVAECLATLSAEMAYGAAEE